MIIDIGSGHKPDNKANILLEHIGMDDEHRGGKKIKTDRPTVLYNTSKIPFKTKSFKSTIYKHVLEHTDDPSSFLNEIERISMGGYIETPSEIAELVFTPYDKHKWVVNIISNTLVLKKKTNSNISKFGKLFNFLCSNESEFKNNFYWKRRALFFIEYYWSGTLKFRIIPSSDKTELDLWSDIVLEKISKLNKINSRRNTMFRKTHYNKSIIFSFLEKQIESPCCQDGVTRLEKNFICNKCKTKFPIDGNIIDLSIKNYEK